MESRASPRSTAAGSLRLVVGQKICLKADAIRELDKKTDRKLAAMEAKIDALLKASYASLAAQGFAEPA